MVLGSDDWLGGGGGRVANDGEMSDDAVEGLDGFEGCRLFWEDCGEDGETELNWLSLLDAEDVDDEGLLSSESGLEMGASEVIDS